jgi:uncharacterized PurR-regulated membrane protein YhhQ (DUF165 family)
MRQHICCSLYYVLDLQILTVSVIFFTLLSNHGVNSLVTNISFDTTYGCIHLPTRFLLTHILASAVENWLRTRPAKFSFLLIFCIDGIFLIKHSIFLTPQIHFS